jgi:FkbM family methyltransferase
MAMISRLKEAALGSNVGGLAHRIRESWRLISSKREQLGWRANDQLAEYYVARLCAPGKVFIDGGAHIGSISGAVQRHCPQARIVAVEAIPIKAQRLARRFPNIVVVNCALAEASGDIEFYVDLDDSAWSTLAKNDRRVTPVIVQARLLDEMGEYGSVDVIKLDLEGAELGALRGGENLINRDRPLIMYESGPSEFMGYSKIDMFEWLAAKDYLIFLPARLGKAALPMSKEVYVDAHQYPFGTLNYFAVPAERLSELSQRVAKIQAR